MKRLLTNLYKTRCDYCGREIEIVPPYETDHASYFWALCPYDDCGKPTKLFFFKGRITSKKPSIQFIPSKAIPIDDRLMRDIIGVVKEGTENEYMEHRKGAAVIYRVAAEMLALGKVLEQKMDGSVQLMGFASALKSIKSGKGRKDLSGRNKSELVNHLQYVKNLGDTSAHPVINNRDRAIQPVPSNLYEARRHLKEAIELLL